MKVKTIILSCLVGVIVLSIPAGLDKYGLAGLKADKSTANVGIVSIRKILTLSKKQADYIKESTAEQNRILAELQTLSKQIEADEAGLKTLKPGSSDYQAQLKRIWQKQADLEAKEKFHKQLLESKDKQWHEQIYQDILRITGELAKQKQLDLVFENSAPELPALSTKDLAMTIRMNKLLYSGGCLDITDEVMARLDAGK